MMLTTRMFSESPGTPGTSAHIPLTHRKTFTPAWEAQFKEGAIIESINGEKVSSIRGSLIPALQDRFFSNKPGELVVLELSDRETGTTVIRTVMTALRPELPLADAAARDTRERLAAPLYGLILGPAAGSSSSFMVQRVIRGSIADERGLSEQDPVSIRGFRIEREAGVALLDISVRQRRMGFMEVSMRLPALLNSPNTL